MVGVMYDPMENLDIKGVLARLPREIVDARNQRLKRAMDLSMKTSLTTSRNEKGLLYALDYGGTNFPVLRVLPGHMEDRVVDSEFEQMLIPHELMYGITEACKICCERELEISTATRVEKRDLFYVFLPSYTDFHWCRHSDQADKGFCGLRDGICHSDLSSIKNEWKYTVYPIVPGLRGCWNCWCIKGCCSSSYSK